MIALPGIEGRVFVVTGGARGQGLSESLLLARLGGRVIAVDVESITPDAYAGTTVNYARLDVTQPDDWNALVRAVEELSEGLPLKGLVNNAGITHRSRLGETDREDWDRVFAINVTGAMLGIQALVPLMAAGSSIVNVGSVAALTAHYPVAYTSSKWALRGLTHVAATEFGPRGIRANIVHPGFIETAMTSRVPAAMRSTQLELTPLERFGESDDVAQVVAFLLSDAAAYVTGAEIPIDGGYASSAGSKLIADRIAAASTIVPPSPGAPRH
ncbi:MAG TPA: SDR family NAD(P)-dependent oxidoreductase [Microbacterium sp.]|nr:SDR family NAD(P)-dependent oxidoreductase [Microbacterium sp.]